TGPGIWGEPDDRAEAIAVLRRALELGITLIDTADSYGPEVSEGLIAAALHPYPKNLVIATKGGLLRPGPDRWTPDGRPEHPRARGACLHSVGPARQRGARRTEVPIGEGRRAAARRAAVAPAAQRAAQPTKRSVGAGRSAAPCHSRPGRPGVAAAPLAVDAPHPQYLPGRASRRERRGGRFGARGTGVSGHRRLTHPPGSKTGCQKRRPTRYIVVIGWMPPLPWRFAHDVVAAPKAGPHTRRAGAPTPPRGESLGSATRRGRAGPLRVHRRPDHRGPAAAAARAHGYLSEDDVVPA